MSKTRDELAKNFSQASAPPDTYASAAETGSNSFPARQPTGERTAPFPAATEYQQPSSNLPMTVSQAQVAQADARRWGSSGPATSRAEATPLVGTQVVADDFNEEILRQARRKGAVR